MCYYHLRMSTQEILFRIFLSDIMIPQLAQNLTLATIVLHLVEDYY